MPLIVKSRLVYLTEKHPCGYSLFTSAKYIGQNWHSELKKIHGRILYGFFYARKMHHAMTGCIEEPSGSPCSFFSGNANSIQPVTLQLALKVTVPKMKKETSPCL